MCQVGKAMRVVGLHQSAYQREVPVQLVPKEPIDSSITLVSQTILFLTILSPKATGKRLVSGTLFAG